MSGSFPNRSILIPFMLVLPPAHDSPFLMDQHDAAPKSPSERRMRGKRGKRGKRFMRYNAPAISETGGPKVPVCMSVWMNNKLQNTSTVTHGRFRSRRRVLGLEQWDVRMQWRL